jgi:tRNA threonylcarbamoyladenosine modification (KEOPS) complex  Pcc1 subunit
VKADATIRLRFSSSKKMKTVYAALKPETDRSLKIRSITELSMEGKLLVLSVRAKDTVALRAAINTYLRWLSSTIDTIAVLGDQLT